MRLLLQSINPTVGALEQNAELILEAASAAREAGADLLALPELTLTGYPPRDLLLREEFLHEVRERATALAGRIEGLTVLVGAPWKWEWAGGDHGLANAILVMRDGAIADVYGKRLLPTYDVFDEDRYFVPGAAPTVIDVGGVCVGVSICEDLWRGEDMRCSPRYAGRADPVEELVQAGAEVIINCSASPFGLRKKERQHQTLARHVARHDRAIATVNQFGANDELIFDGEAAVYIPDAHASRGARFYAGADMFEQSRLLLDVVEGGRVTACDPALDRESEQSDEEQLWRALRLGVHDYCAKTGLHQAVIGLSGGADSSLVACVAAAALGPENVLGVSMPSVYSTSGSETDAEALARSIGMQIVKSPIRGSHEAVREALLPAFEAAGAGDVSGVTDENLQARLRGLSLMAFANRLGRIVLTTGNKSEYATGYCTLYGDMNGGLAVIADVYKTLVYSLSRWLNEHPARAGFDGPPIPPDVLTKPPSAELRPDQTDQDSLPPYDQLDDILHRHIEEGQGLAEIVEATGLSRWLVAETLRLLDRSEHKRWQSPPTLKVTEHAFGIGWRMPIAQGWRRASSEAPESSTRAAAQASIG